MEKTNTQLALLYPGILANQAHALKRFPETTFIFLKTTSAAKGLALVYEIQVTGEINTSQEGERPHSDDKKSFKKLKDKRYFFSYFRI